MYIYTSKETKTVLCGGGECDEQQPKFLISHGIKMYIKADKAVHRKSILNAPNLNKICNLFLVECVCIILQAHFNALKTTI